MSIDLNNQRSYIEANQILNYLNDYTLSPSTYIDVKYEKDNSKVYHIGKHVFCFVNSKGTFITNLQRTRILQVKPFNHDTNNEYVFECTYTKNHVYIYRVIYDKKYIIGDMQTCTQYIDSIVSKAVRHEAYSTDLPYNVFISPGKANGGSAIYYDYKKNTMYVKCISNEPIKSLPLYKPVTAIPKCIYLQSIRYGIMEKTSMPDVYNIIYTDGKTATAKVSSLSDSLKYRSWFIGSITTCRIGAYMDRPLFLD